MGLAITFWILAIVSILSALGVVLLRNVFHAALALILCFLSVAGLYVTLQADFVAAVQILIYIGAISILIILAIMLTRDVPQGSPANQLRVPALIVGVLFFAVVTWAMTNTPWPISSTPPKEETISVIGERLFGANGFILPVELVAVLLLAAIIGAIVLVREK